MIVDMGDLPESHVSMPELAELIHKWPPAVINHMMWRQRELEQMRKAAKREYRQKHPAPCTFCGTIIKTDMYRHVACCHLKLAQLWRCPVSWCTVWKGTPQDLMDHIRDSHNVPGEIRGVSLEMLFPPWTVTRQLYVESLTAQHSGISNDVLLFSEVGLSLVHHYRVHRIGRPHAAFRGKYLAQLRDLLPVSTILSTAGGPSGAACSPVSSTALWMDILDPNTRSARGTSGASGGVSHAGCSCGFIGDTGGPTVVPDDVVQPPTGSVGCSPIPRTTPAEPTLGKDSSFQNQPWVDLSSGGEPADYRLPAAPLMSRLCLNTRAI